MTTRIRTYRELLALDTFLERFRYLELRGQVGVATFGTDRWINQQFYASREWRELRYEVIARDENCDLAHPDHEIFGRPYIHHMNPMTVDSIQHGDYDILNPELLVTVSHRTHNAIHYGDESLLPQPYVPRRPGDTKDW